MWNHHSYSWPLFRLNSISQRKMNNKTVTSSSDSQMDNFNEIMRYGTLASMNFSAFYEEDAYVVGQLWALE